MNKEISYGSFAEIHPELIFKKEKTMPEKLSFAQQLLTNKTQGQIQYIEERLEYLIGLLEHYLEMEGYITKTPETQNELPLQMPDPKEAEGKNFGV